MFKRLRLTLLALSVTALSVHAQKQPPGAPPEEPPYEGPVITRPNAAPLPVNFRLAPYRFDGYERTRSELSCSLFSAHTLAPQNWAQTSLPGASLVFQGTYYPDVKWAFNIWSPESFLPNLSKTTMTAYAEGIKKTYPELVEVLNYDSDYRSVGIGAVFNRDPRTLIYQITSPENGKLTLRYDTFVLFKDHLLEFSLWGPPDEVKQMLGWFSVFPDNLSLTTADEDYAEEISRAYTDPPPEDAPKEDKASTRK
ncbi:hypothetical protein H5P28_09855 [Ruficoccus amylovorans]|uniref:Chalcone isomerase domain-containing protein n=1 Tax=Ruficoccus amylovorans TaxID=1804625 RepID=A0A842HDQ0_9BACT|nr:hypothetical protein [Ruficoccus amylovorans]MBC2594562.1 hypothetical protein [Ruficoccus amylovorans]